MTKFSDKRGSKKKKKIKSFEKLFNFICFLSCSDGGDGVVVMAAAIYCAMVLVLRGVGGSGG